MNIQGTEVYAISIATLVRSSLVAIMPLTIRKMRKETKPKRSAQANNRNGMPCLKTRPEIRSKVLQSKDMTS